MKADVIKVRYTIEPVWTIDGYTDVIEIDAEELEGLAGKERAKAIEEVVQDVINDLCPWGFEEVEAQ